MIESSNAVRGINMADRLGLRKLSCSPFIANLLSTCVSAELSEKLEVSDSDWGTLSPENITGASMSQGADEQYHHDLAVNAAVDAVVKGVNAIYDLTTNVVNPNAKEILGKIEAQKEYELPASRRPVVKPVFLPNFAGVEFLEELIVSQKANVTKKVELPKELVISADKWRVLTETERMALVASENAKLNTFLKTLIGEVGDYFSLGELSGYSSAQGAILNWAYISRLEKNIPDNLSMLLVDYNAMMLSARKQFARLAEEELRRLERRVKAGYLFVDAPNQDLKQYSIRVYGDTYNQWLSQGGSIEALYGIIINRKTDQRASALTNFDHYLAVYKAWSDKQNLVLQSQYQSLVLETTKDELIKFISSSDVTPREAEVAVKATLAQMTLPTALTTERWVREVIVKTLMPNSNVMAFIDEIATVAAANKELTLPECAELARLHVLGDWLATLVLPVDPSV